MAQISFKDLVVIANSLKVDYDLLMDDTESRNSEPISQALEISEREWDKLHTLQVIVTDLYKLRPLPF